METTGKSEIWKPLNCLVEAASRSKSVKVNGQSSGQNVDFQREEVKEAESPAPVKARRRRRRSKALAESSCVKHEMGTSPIWFSLTAATDQLNYLICLYSFKCEKWVHLLNSIF